MTSYRLLPLLLLIGLSNLCGFELGANFNESPSYATPKNLKVAEPSWVRCFLPASEFIDGKRDLNDDSNLKAFLASREQGSKLCLTFKWDFRERNTSPPAPTSPEETRMFEWAAQVVKKCEPDLLCLVNEVFIDTKAEDLLATPGREIPMVLFLQRLTKSIANRFPEVPLSSGGFTRLDTKRIQTHPATLAMLTWLEQCPEISAVNFHLHHNDLQEFEQALSFIRGRIPSKPFVVTEFSPVWNYRKNLNSQLQFQEADSELMQRLKLGRQSTFRHFLNACVDQPISAADYHQILNRQHWYDPDFLVKACALMDKYNTRLATYAYVHGASGSTRQLDTDTTPWALNALIITAFCKDEPDGSPPINRDFLPPFQAPNK